MKLLVKIGILVASLIMHISGLAQNSDKVYNTFDGKDGSMILSINKTILEPFEFLLDDATQKLIYKMEKVKFLSYNDEKGSLSSFEAYEKIAEKLDGGRYFDIDPEELDCEDCQFEVEVEKEEAFKLIGHRINKNKLDELHVLLQNDNRCILFSFYGEILVEDLKGCTNFSQSTKGLFNP